MTSVYLKLSPSGGRYFKEFASNCKVEILVDWLRDDVSNWYESWREWLNNTSEAMQDTESNATWLEKDGDMVTLGAITHIMMFEHEGLSTPEEFKVTITIKNAVELVNAWEKLLEIRPLKIILYEERGIYRLEEVQ